MADELNEPVRRRRRAKNVRIEDDGTRRVVPDVVGMMFEPAFKQLIEAGLRTARVDELQSEVRRGTVLRIDPPAGSSTARTVIVQIVVAVVSGRPCDCCGYLTISSPETGSFEICPVCFWEDDNVQAADPTYAGGANKVSLDEARRNYKSFSACEDRSVPHVRPPHAHEEP